MNLNAAVGQNLAQNRPGDIVLSNSHLDRAFVRFQCTGQSQTAPLHAENQGCSNEYLNDRSDLLTVPCFSDWLWDCFEYPGPVDALRSCRIFSKP